ncbi:MAG: hypothetical protein ABEI57_05705 [Halapricum sp.]
MTRDTSARDTDHDDEQSDAVVYRAWCENEECDWSEKTTASDEVRAQERSAKKMAGHGIATGHHETRHEEVDDAE